MHQLSFVHRNGGIPWHPGNEGCTRITVDVLMSVARFSGRSDGQVNFCGKIAVKTLSRLAYGKNSARGSKGSVVIPHGDRRPAWATRPLAHRVKFPQEQDLHVRDKLPLVAGELHGPEGSSPDWDPAEAPEQPHQS
jgi:hypothetical protein